MDSDEAKALLERRLKIPAGEWKRRSKKSDGRGGCVREFESLQGGRVAVAESASGRLTILFKPAEPAQAAKTKRPKPAEQESGLDAMAANTVRGSFANGCSQPSRARVWGGIAGDPWGMPSPSGTLFDGMECDELTDHELFVGPAKDVEDFLAKAAKRIQSCWKASPLVEAGDYDCAVLAVWEDGSPWVAAGFFRMSQAYEAAMSAPPNMGWDLRQMAKADFSAVLRVKDEVEGEGAGEDLVQRLSDLAGAPPEAARAAALFMGEDRLAELWRDGVAESDRKLYPAVEDALGRVRAAREGRAIGASAQAASLGAKRRSI